MLQAISRSDPTEPAVGAVPEEGPAGTMLLDVTIRDGGYVNGHSWTVDEASAIVAAVDAAGVPYAEVGYLRPRRNDPLKPSAACSSWYLAALRPHAPRTGLVVMVRPGEAEPEDLVPLADQGVSMVRVLVPRGDATVAMDHVAAGKKAGLLVATNLVRMSELTPEDLAAAARRCADAGADLVYLADSNGGMFPEDVSERIAAVVTELAGTGATVGFHAHDNLSLAFANSRAALDAGAAALDASLVGIGKGGGNLCLELIIAHQIAHHGQPYRLDPLTDHGAVLAARLRMVAERGRGTLVAGLLDVNLDQAYGFQQQVAAVGFDALLSDRYAARSAMLAV